ncbi:hypothetical protein [Coleofasciculus sp. FACHB-SPT9]|uniref:hypothetical protein n=1 Tax=Cyanophyceae TaxID=3028117 RepID=UPI001686DABD|nr:hypothetical protein [Coleofasciculus sp. FACHB-SPT9]MBD1892746.1 hypothetical protein [Coleofasciculus sp. FACHB-SPT9]
MNRGSLPMVGASFPIFRAVSELEQSDLTGEPAHQIPDFSPEVGDLTFPSYLELLCLIK